MKRRQMTIMDCLAIQESAEPEEVKEPPKKKYKRRGKKKRPICCLGGNYLAGQAAGRIHEGILRGPSGAPGAKPAVHCLWSGDYTHDQS